MLLRLRAAGCLAAATVTLRLQAASVRLGVRGNTGFDSASESDIRVPSQPQAGGRASESVRTAGPGPRNLN
jgi:hypothetical protein